jgi:hypothetical protein
MKITRFATPVDHRPTTSCNCNVSFTDELVRLHNYTSYCQCRPKCHRITYDVTATQAMFSEFGTTLYALKDGGIDRRLESLFKIQDLVFLNAVNPNMLRQLLFEVNNKTSSLIKTSILRGFKNKVMNLNRALQNLTTNGFARNVSDCTTELANNVTDIIVTKFVAWYNDSHFTSHTVEKGDLDDFLVLVTHDLVRKHYKFLGWMNDMMSFIIQADELVNAIPACFSVPVPELIGLALSDCSNFTKKISAMAQQLQQTYMNVNNTISELDTVSSMPRLPSMKTKEWYK